jgi:hypothetical protein
MKQGTYGTLERLAGEVLRQANTKRDLVVPSSSLTVSDGNGGKMFVSVGSEDKMKMTNLATSQLGSRLGIPNSYINTLKAKSTELLTYNMNYLANMTDKNFMVRSLDDKARAFMSDRYKRIDNAPVFEMAWKAIEEADTEVNLASCDVTENRMYLKIVSPN